MEPRISPRWFARVIESPDPTHINNDMANMDFAERIGRRITLHDLHVLLAVVAAGSMGKAASRLHASQPAISRTVAELER